MKKIKKRVLSRKVLRDGSIRTDFSDGAIQIEMSNELMNVLKKQLALFEKKFGRKPQGKEPVFFDPDFDTPTPVSLEKLADVMITAAKKAQVDPYRALRHVNFSHEEAEFYLKTRTILEQAAPEV